MCNKYYDEVGKTIHTKYVACRYEIKWNIKSISGDSNANGFIVQRFKRTATPALDFLKDISYYEAWQVRIGKCDGDRVFDDGYNVFLYPSDRLQNQEELVDAIVYSVGTSGRLEFKGDVYWIPKTSRLYAHIAKWNMGTISEAGNLLSTRTFTPLDSKKPLFDHNFEHNWNFTNEELIVETAYHVFNSAFPEKVRNDNLRINVDSMSISENAKRELKSRLRIK